MAQKYTVKEIAKYHAMGIAIVQQEIGEKQLTVADLYEYYEAALKDIVEVKAIDNSVKEFDKMMKLK